jgi:hypothetical protein
METKTVARINQVSIQLVIDNKERLVPIKPICEAMGVDEDAQRRKLQEDEFLSSVTVLSKATGSDGKQYEMVCLPFEFVFGWIFTINPKNVKEEAREAVSKYRIECYRALYKHFSAQADFLNEKQVLLDQQIEYVERIRNEFSSAKYKLAEAQKRLTEVRSLTLEDWEENNRQLKIEFDSETSDE